MDHQISSNSSIAPLIISFLILIIMAIQRYNKKSGSKRKLPPGPRGLPIIGNMHQLIGAPPHRRLADLAKKHGPVMYLKLGQVENVVVSSRQAAEEVLRTNDILLAQRPISAAAAIISYNCRDIGLAPYGEYWRQVRKIFVVHLTSAKQVESFSSVRKVEAATLIRSISSSDGSSINLSKMLLSAATNIISKASFSDSCKRVDAFTELVARISEILGAFNIAAFFPSVGLLHRISGVTEKMMKLHREIDDVLESIIEEYKGSKEEGRTKANDILGVLLDLRNQGGPEESLSMDSIKAILFDVFFGGIDTTATVLEWTMSEIMRHPEVMKKVQAEVRMVFQNKSAIDELGLHQLKYMNAVIKEALRLHLILLPREARESLTIGGYEIAPKTIILVNAFALARDPEVWKDAEKFHPERFLETSFDYEGNHMEYIPFGAGRRMCPGIMFGMSTVELMLANLLYHFNWELSIGMKPESLDMTEVVGVTIRRKNDLCLVASQYCP